MRYLDPKNDLVFKKIFGQHPHLLKSFLNALLPLKEDEYIEELEYLPPEQVPEIPELKNSIVDVKCRDNNGRQFVVEMQMLWTDSFKSRVLFNASKAYVRQLGKSRKYEILQPVYALSLVDDIFSDEKEKFYHHYAIVDTEDPESRLDGLEFVFIELPKFKQQTLTDKKMMALWLRFMTEIEDQQEDGVDKELFEDNNIKEALEILQESAFTKAELEYYDRVWDAIGKERTLLHERTAKAKIEGHKEGHKEGRKEGIEIGIEKSKIEIAQNLLQDKVPLEIIIQSTGLSEEEINRLK